jgi:hypothetical protein
MPPSAAGAPLRRTLLVNAALAAGCAAALVGAAPRLASHLAPATAELVPLGFLLAAGALVAVFVATRRDPSRRWVAVAAWVVALADLGAAAAAIAALVGGAGLTTAGNLLLAVAALAGGLLAAAIVFAVRRLRRAGGRAAPAAPRRRWLARLGRGLAWVVGAVALFALLYALLPWADLRSLQVRAAGSDPGAAERGRELLRAVAEAHGLAALGDHRTMEVVAEDRWAKASPWWPAPRQRLRAQRLLGSFDSRVELLDGPGAGQIWGLQSWTPYRAVGGGAPQALAEDPAITFYLTSLHYFDELPFRLLGAETVIEAGTGRLGDREYRRVFATWGGALPHRGADHYELWIDPATRRLAKATYTVREAAGFAEAALRPLYRLAGVGTIHFDDYREVDGVLVAFSQAVTIGGPEQVRGPPEEAALHRLTVESVAFDVVAPEALAPLPGLPPPGDRKPG